MKRLITLCLLGGCFLSAPAQNYVSQAWVADQGNGTYKNPVLYADYSDPDVCRVGDDYYLTSSSFNCLPGLQILHSKDLVNWTIIGAAVPYALPPRSAFRHSTCDRTSPLSVFSTTNPA
jgi:beta-xylosidase